MSERASCFIYGDRKRRGISKSTEDGTVRTHKASEVRDCGASDLKRKWRSDDVLLLVGGQILVKSISETFRL